MSPPMKANICLSTIIVCTVLIWPGYEYQLRAEGVAGQKQEITIEEAIKIARTAIKKEGHWQDMKITSAVLREEKWRVLVSRVPGQPGGYTTVVISETGDIVRIERGQ